jgi:hypothetical protein
METFMKNHKISKIAFLALLAVGISFQSQAMKRFEKVRLGLAVIPEEKEDDLGAMPEDDPASLTFRIHKEEDKQKLLTFILRDAKRALTLDLQSHEPSTKIKAENILKEIKEAIENDLDYFVQTPLIVFLTDHDCPVAVEVLATHTGSGMHDQKGRTALIAAAEHGYLEIVKVLLALGANPHKKDNSGRTAAMYAQERKDEEMVAILQLAGKKYPKSKN